MKNETIAPAPTITKNGNVYPAYNGEALSWSIGLYFTHNERLAGFPRARAVILAMREHYPDALESERRQMAKSSLADPMFRHSAHELMKIIESV